MDFNYEKAWFQLAKPAYLNFNKKQSKAHKQLCMLVSKRAQDRILAIPMSPQMKSVCKKLTCKELAEVSCASYFAGHWQPGNTEKLFHNSSGCSWKAANVIDQILRSRLDLPDHIQIHEGKFRRTWSGRDFWTWEEFGLATEENLQKYKEFDLKFDPQTCKHNVHKLAALIGDLWPDVNTLEDSEEYIEFLKEKILIKKEAQRKRDLKHLEGLQRKKETVQMEIDGFQWLYDHGISQGNCIFYSHTRIFTFGWSTPLSEVEVSEVVKMMDGFPFKYEIKEAAK